MLGSALTHIHRLMMMVAIAVVCIWALDHLTTFDDAQPPALPAGATAPDHPGNPRVFVLLVDSLRFATAIDPEQMPHLAAMRDRAMHAKLLSSRDAVTVSAIREMFTGRERFLAFGFVRDFLTGRESAESLFTQTKSASIGTRVYPPYAFVQFGDDLSLEMADDNVADRDAAQQNRWVMQGLERFTSGEVPFVIAHIVYSDRIAHDHGVHAQVYRDTMRSVDDLIAAVDAQIADGDTLVVTGDHGHTDDGRHSLGLDVPSFALYRGPGFRSGTDLGTVPITAHRYFMSWGLELPLTEDYGSSRHPDALVSAAAMPAAYAHAVSPGQARQRLSGPKGNLWAFLMLALDVGLLAGVWLSLIWRNRGDWSRPMVAAHWLSVAAMAAVVLDLHMLLVPPVLVGVACWRRPDRRALQWAVVGAALGLIVHGWGGVLAAYRSVVHEPTFDELELMACAAIVITAMFAIRLGATRASWLTLALLGALGYPTVYRYGAMPALVTMWLAWLAATLVDGRRSPRLKPALLMAVGVFLLIQPFAFADAGNFEHHTWRPWLSAIMPHGHQQWLWATLAFKLVVFVRWSSPHRGKVLGLLAAVHVHLLHWTAWDLSDGQYVSLIFALAVAGALVPRYLDDGVAPDVQRVCWLWAAYLGYYYTIRIPHDHYMWVDCFLAALVLSAGIAKRCTRTGQLPNHEAVLSMLGLAVAGWVTVAWTLHLYEWKVFYAWFTAASMEEHALWLMPFINARYLLPVVMSRLVLRGELRHAQPYPRRHVWTALGVKVVSLAGILTGLGYAIADSGAYLEAIGEAATLIVLSVGLL